jgi:hypothetical protein
MLSMRHFLVPLLIAALAFAVGQSLPGFGVLVAVGGSFIWIAMERRRAKMLGLTCQQNK